MLNEVQIEGIIARAPWTYDRDLFFRIASYRDADMPAKPDVTTPGRDEPDYITVRVPGGATSLMTATRGDRVRVHGFLQSRDFKETLGEFMRKAGSDSVGGVDPKEANSLKADRNTVEVVAGRVVRMDERRPEERPRRSSAPPPAPPPVSAPAAPA
ncbi:MAG: hypothetical protein RBS68_16555 [Anaerolineales bacterium]|jgi:hypothetical protein|nr:hypothetical protein [Anaerolineales bacterium]